MLLSLCLPLDVDDRVSYLEIYNETMSDLLSTMPETWKNKEEGQDQAMVVVENQDGVYVKGLSCHLAQSEEEALNLLFEVWSLFVLNFVKKINNNFYNQIDIFQHHLKAITGMLFNLSMTQNVCSNI